MRTRALLTALTLAAAPLTATAVVPAAAARGTDRQIAYTAWDTSGALAAGRAQDVRVVRGTVRLADPDRTTRYAGSTWERGTWTSPWVSPGFAFTELVPSWEARTPAGTFVQVEVRGRSAGGTRSSWDGLGRWASYDTGFRRTSLGSQSDDLGTVATDTWRVRGLTQWQVRATLLRKAGTTASPRLDAVGAMVSRLPATSGVATSTPGAAAGTVLAVPTYSQMVHQGHYPQWGGGGQAWCSPTSLAMVLGYYRALPSTEETAWAGDHAFRVVDHLARSTYDYGYRGTGNWPFNTAYAATRVQQAFVTRLASLRDVERFIAAGIPVVASISFGSGELRGAPISSTNGHLLVVVGFTASGDVVVNDPAADPRQGEDVRRVYDRGAFEDVWLRRGTAAGGSGGLVYVVRDAAHPLPARQGVTRW
ncbi:MAG TPA: peptidase C39 family protein [Nocardioides sp.]|nr:peptidase C39 family protein [Nocardioides sp.]